MKIFLTTCCFIVLVGCRQQTENKVVEQPVEQLVQQEEKEVSVAPTSEEKDEILAVIEGLDNRSFPLADSTNFDNVDKKGIHNPDFLKRIHFEADEVNFKDVRLRYRLHYSPAYYSIVLTYPLGEHEIITTLLNINKEGKIIDFLDIAYDEIAESAFRKESVMEKDRVVLTDWNYMSEVPTKTVTNYLLTSEGRFEEAS
ncbi:hypothetical protein [Sphingobacterium sp. 1.A.4]|uniref:hypothetical protein n=1 Tax=Sphingobacterium sp. 1.A.4 TaxID=2044603 RepID=UPI000C0BE366|nr:hypothetical protein [Sphingobacterium sp. 1.A.4]